MGAKEWADLVNKALMAKTTEGRGDLEQTKIAWVYITYELCVIYIYISPYIQFESLNQESLCV